jgi:hypothetical protein
MIEDYIYELIEDIIDFIKVSNINIIYSVSNNIPYLYDPNNYEVYIHIDKVDAISRKINRSNQVVSLCKLNTTVYDIIADILQTSLRVSNILPNIKIEIFNIIEDMYLENPVAYIYIKPNGVK